MKTIFLALIVLIFTTSSFAQRALSEQVSYFDIRTPNQPLDSTIETYKVYVEIPYTLTLEELEAESLIKFDEEKVNYVTVLKESEVEYEKRLSNHDAEVIKAEERYQLEMKHFKELSLLERLAMTDQGKQPKLIVPSKPIYVKPREPKYRNPDLNDYLIFDKEVLADAVILYGYEKGIEADEIVFIINISKMKIQDNAGKTFYNQPTNLMVMKASEVIHEKNFNEEYKLLTASSSNTINLDRYEKNNVNTIMKNVTKYINEEFGYIPIASKIKIEYPKNKSRAYDVLENAKIKALSAYRKLKKESSLKTREQSKIELENLRIIWKQELAKINYNDKKAVMNKNVAKMIFFNLMRVDISLKDKTKAEETLNEMQNRRIDLDLNYDEKQTFTRLEEQVYKM